MPVSNHDFPTVEIYDAILPEARLAISQGSDLVVVDVENVEKFAAGLVDTARRVIAARAAFNA
jgi:hypothetical protein